ncbi:4679_t:CDS:1, partial [Gigaspora rosea]
PEHQTLEKLSHEKLHLGISTKGDNCKGNKGEEDASPLLALNSNPVKLKAWLKCGKKSKEGS